MSYGATQALQQRAIELLEVIAGAPPGGGTGQVGGATAANQATEIQRLEALVAAVDGLEALLGGTLQVAAGALPLPAGAATEGKVEAVRALVAGLLTNAQLRASALLVTPSVLGRTSREYAHTGVRQPVAAGSAAFALPQLGATREVRVSPSTRTWLRFGATGVAAAVAGESIPFAIDAGEVVVVPADATHFAVIRAGGDADGFVTLTPVA